MNPTVLTIAGSDPSGGAGIQRDLRTFSDFHVAGLSAISAITVQNSRGIIGIHPIDPDVLADQLNAIMEDTRPDAVKIGMLTNSRQVRIVADALRRFQPRNVVLDPVLASSGGVPFLDIEGQKVLLTELMPLCDLVTPNLQEAEVLTELFVHDSVTVQMAGARLLASGARAVLLKGGHLSGAPHDFLFVQDGHPFRFPGFRITTEHTHGTGCLLSSAIAASLARGANLRNAIHGAKEFVTEALRHPIILGKGRGYPDKADFERNYSLVPPRSHVDRLSRLQGIYVLTDPKIRPDRSPDCVLAAALSGGGQIFQLRDKYLPTPQLVQLAGSLRTTVHAADRLFIVNDRVDIALASDADGVHLGPDDIHPADARRLLGPDKLIGISTGTMEEATAAAPYASYFGVGAVFGTRTKSDAGAPIGVERIREIKAAFPHIPIVAIGGINAQNIMEVASAGADAAAVVSAVIDAANMEEATRELVNLFLAGKRERRL